MSWILTWDYNMTDFQAKICEKFNINSLTDNQSKSITAIIDGKDVFVGTKTGSVKHVLIGCSYH
jgi:superfamily II DNA/RNA helicase